MDRVETPNINRIARFCGPKRNGKFLKPFDGARKIKNSWKKDEMAMWDSPFNTYRLGFSSIFWSNRLVSDELTIISVVKP